MATLGASLVDGFAIGVGSPSVSPGRGLGGWSMVDGGALVVPNSRAQDIVEDRITLGASHIDGSTNLLFIQTATRALTKGHTKRFLRLSYWPLRDQENKIWSRAAKPAETKML